MDALLLALIACMAAEMGDRSQMLTLAMGQRYRRDRLVALGLLAAATANAIVSASAGALIARTLGSDARMLFMALAFLIGGAAMLLPVRAPDVLANWRLGAWASPAIGLFILGFGEGAQFLIMGVAVGRSEPVLAGLGGALGVMCACLPAILVGPGFFVAVPLRRIRQIVAVLFLIAGFSMGVSALRLT
jgi:Ca2+/H+ antiporter, TMEM165/GDT1 family